MTISTTCTACGARQPLQAGFIEDDGKRLAALFGGMQPPLYRAVVSYLQLFAPAKRSLGMARAIKIVQELLQLVDAGTVCADERGGLRRPATSAMWISGIEQMLQQRDRLGQLDNHNYLRKIVFGLADQADAKNESAREQQLQRGEHRAQGKSTANAEDPITAARRFAEQMFVLGTFTGEQRDQHIADAVAKHSGSAP